MIGTGSRVSTRRRSAPIARSGGEALPRRCVSGSVRLAPYGAPVARPDFPRTIMEFQERFATEAACLEYLAASRWPEGFVCPVCGGRAPGCSSAGTCGSALAAACRPRSRRGRSCTGRAPRCGTGSGPPTWSPPITPGSRPSSCSASSGSRAMRRRG